VLLLLPSVAAVGIFVYGFIGWTLYVSFSNWNSFVPDLSWAGLTNYRELWGSFRFQADLRNTAVFTVTFLAASLSLGLLLAVLLDRGVWGEPLFRNVFLFPMAVSFVVTGITWQWLLNPTTGVNLLFDRLGLPGLKSGWYTDPPVAILSVVLAATWQMSGFTMALYLAGLRGVSEELLEAARADGATEWQLFRHVVFPLLHPVTLSGVIVLGHISLKIFDLVYAMTGSGPAFSTDVPGVFMFETTFRGNRFAEGAALSVFMLVLVALLVVPYLSYTLKQEAR
jgi:glucose/mannose transport system permease protein